MNCNSACRKACEVYAATQAELKKDTKSFQDCQDQGIDFIPICIETCGNWGKIARQHFKSLIERIGYSPSFWPPSFSRNMLFLPHASLLHSSAAIATLSFAVPPPLYPPSKQPHSCSNVFHKILPVSVKKMLNSAVGTEHRAKMGFENECFEKDCISVSSVL